MDSKRLRALELAKGLAATAACIRRVAASTSEEAAAWAFTQWALRKQAKSKFEMADRMLFVREALEQATSEAVAAYHASRFPKGALVADLTAGVGADLIALARRGPAMGFELDDERAEACRFNLGALGLEAEVVAGDCLASSWDFEYAFGDPSRRVAGKRTLDPGSFSPDPTDLAVWMQGLEIGGIKLSPLLPDPFLESLGSRLEFISYGGECREALVWTGRGVDPGRFAVKVESGDALHASGRPPQAETPGSSLYEADPAAVRAHCLGALCTELGLKALGDSNGNLTGDGHLSSPWLTEYRVLHAGRGDLKTTAKALRDLDGTLDAVKSRAKGVDVAALGRKLSTSGRRKCCLLVYPVGPSLRHVLAERG